MLQQTISLAAFFIVISANVAELQNSACEQLIECYVKSRAKEEECLMHNKNECWNESLQTELKGLNNERISFYENCLREKSPIAMNIENAKKRAKCSAILQKNAIKQGKVGMNEKGRGYRKNRRSVHKDKKSNAQQKLCFREARKLKSYCGQLSKCCTINKLCKVNTQIGEKITAKRMEIKEAYEKCQLEHSGSTKGGRKNKRGRRRKSKHSDLDT
uniref:Uncharacterized protein n=1 Tax=Setaria digitata TaxID=48799 RepID=A0A915PJG3_9BILA